MKRLMTNMIAAAALVAAAGIASAQTMEGKIPFAFRAGSREFPAGTYRVKLTTSNSGNSLIFITGAPAAKNLLAYTYRDGYAKTAWIDADRGVLVFRCAEERCTLSNLWMPGAGEQVFRVPAPAPRKDAPISVAEVVLRPIKAD